MMPLFSAAPKLADGTVVRIGEASVRLKVNARARRVSLRIDARTGEAVATAPSARRLPDALRFAESRADWIARHVAALPPAVAFAPGVQIVVEGAPCRLERSAMRIKPRLIPATATEPARLIASGEGEAYARAVTRALKAAALERVAARTAHYAAALACPLPEITVMDARMRWGSCRQAGGRDPARIRYNWRLILAPAWILDYVAAHEAAHLIEANHSPAYWDVVRRIFGDHRPARAWLRTHGATLHAMGWRSTANQA
jgi:predicted metal-dependent hydrolase